MSLQLTLARVALVFGVFSQIFGATVRRSEHADLHHLKHHDAYHPLKHLVGSHLHRHLDDHHPLDHLDAHLSHNLHDSHKVEDHVHKLLDAHHSLPRLDAHHLLHNQDAHHVEAHHDAHHLLHQHDTHHLETHHNAHHLPHHPDVHPLPHHPDAHHLAAHHPLHHPVANHLHLPLHLRRNITNLRYEIPDILDVASETFAHGDFLLKRALRYGDVEESALVFALNRAGAIKHELRNDTLPASEDPTYLIFQQALELMLAELIEDLIEFMQKNDEHLGSHGHEHHPSQHPSHLTPDGYLPVVWEAVYLAEPKLLELHEEEPQKALHDVLHDNPSVLYGMYPHLGDHLHKEHHLGGEHAHHRIGVVHPSNHLVPVLTQHDSHHVPALAHQDSHHVPVTTHHDSHHVPVLPTHHDSHHVPVLPAHHDSHHVPEATHHDSHTPMATHLTRAGHLKVKSPLLHHLLHH